MAEPESTGGGFAPIAEIWSLIGALLEIGGPEKDEEEAEAGE